MSFEKKVVWITGASSGIGEALAYALYRRGAHLILSSRRSDELEQVKNNCGEGGADIKVLPLDLAETETLEGKASEVLQHFGRVDYLFNNGGISQRSLAMETKMEVIRKIMEVNFFGTVALTKTVLPSMIERQSGQIIVTSSVMGKFGTQLRSAYAASKHALHGWFDSLRLEIEDDNIGITIVCPGYVKTKVTINALKADGSKHMKMGKGQEEGMEPEEFVEELLPKVLRGEEEVYIGGKEIYGVYLKRWAPKLLKRLLKTTDTT
ncbi:MAG: SDR family oxidoreductase [Balneolaceae bacterium]|nr:SDR family oxidoreductase [Balneolaceae bacterium]